MPTTGGMPFHHAGQGGSDQLPMFDCMLLGCIADTLTLTLTIEAILDASQPGQHGLRAGHSIEEYVVTARVILDKTLPRFAPV